MIMCDKCNESRSLGHLGVPRRAPYSQPVVVWCGEEGLGKDSWREMDRILTTEMVWGDQKERRE